MKLLTLFIILFSSISFANAGGFKFPNQPYAYAQLHLFNTHYEKGRPDLHIYKNGVYAQSKVGNGLWLNDKFLTQLNSILAKGIDEIWMGLSKCTIPRHGIIFYNNNNKPIASISICFECQQVNFWSSKDMNHQSDYDNLDLEKAERQIKDLKKLIKTTSIPVFDDKSDYIKFVENEKRFKNEGKMDIKVEGLDSIFGHKILINEIKKWTRGNLRLKQDTLEKMTNTDSYFFYEYSSKEKNDNTNFIMSSVDDNAYLIQAEIYNPNVLLPNGVSVGMSTDDVVGMYPVPHKEVPNYPETLTIYDEKSKLVYTFKNQTLVKIMIYVWVK